MTEVLFADMVTLLHGLSWLLPFFPFLPDGAGVGRSFQRSCLLTFTVQH